MTNGSHPARTSAAMKKRALLTAAFLLAAALISAGAMIQGAGMPVWNRFFAWATGPYILLLLIFIFVWPTRQSHARATASILAAATVLFFTCLFYIYAMWLSAAAASAIIFMFAPAYLFIGGMVGWGVTWALLERRARKLSVPAISPPAATDEQRPARARQNKHAPKRLSPGLIAALQHSLMLPSFANREEAEIALFELRDSCLRALLEVTDIAPQLDFSPQSLIPLERWFFEAGEPESLPSGAATKLALGFYLGEVFCRHAGFTWVVYEFPFVRGKYEIGVERGLFAMMLMRGRRPVRENNVRMQSLFREYRKRST
jgi:predicted small secreted protein